MPLVQYSPWTDAASYGQGLGDTLGRILLQLPQIRQQQAMQRTEFPLQMRLLQAQAGAAEAKPGIEQELMKLRYDTLQNQINRTSDLNQYQKGQLDLRKQMLDIQELLHGKPKEATSEQVSTEGKKALDTYASNLAAKQGIDTKATPIVASPDVTSQAMTGAQQAGQTNGLPFMGAFQTLVKLGSVLAPLLQTNMVPKVTPSTGFGGHLGIGNPAVTNMIPQVSTNAFQMQMPPQQQAPPVMPPGQTNKIADVNIITQALQMAGGNKKSARQWLQDNGYTIPQVP